MSQNHLFIIDPLSSLNVRLDTSLRLMFALSRQNHKVFFCQPNQLSWNPKEPCTQALAAEITFEKSCDRFATGKSSPRSLRDFSGIHMRKDPPFDIEYVNTTLLLDSAEPVSVIFNRPSALRSLNEKLSIFRFPEFIRDALVSAQPAEILEFIQSSANGDGILKPLSLFGGRGIMRIKIDDLGLEATRELLAKETAGATKLRLVQPFDPAVFEGEVRVFTAAGEDIAWCLKVPAPGNFLANTGAGAQLAPYEPSASERKAVLEVSQSLIAHGVQICGFDIIGGYISEINITSPRLLNPTADDDAPYMHVADKIIGLCS